MAAGRCQPMYVYNKKALIEQKRSPFCTLGRLSGSPACLLSDDHDRSSTAPINYPLYTHVLGLHLLGHISMILFYPTCSNLRAPFHHVQLAIYIYISPNPLFITSMLLTTLRTLLVWFIGSAGHACPTIPLY